jgi:hypothetical protein
MSESPLNEASVREGNISLAVALRCPNCNENRQLVVILALGLPRVFICGSCGSLMTVSRCKNEAGDMVTSPNHQAIAASALDALVEWWKAERSAFFEQMAVTVDHIVSEEDN